MIEMLSSIRAIRLIRAIRQPAFDPKDINWVTLFSLFFFCLQ